MRKFLVLLMALVLVVGICGCAKTGESAPTKTAESTKESVVDKEVKEDESVEASKEESTDVKDEKSNDLEKDPSKENNKTDSNKEADKDVDPLEKVDKTLAKIMGNEDFQALSMEEKAAKLLPILEQLVEQGYITPDSIHYEDGDDVISYEYANGILGGVMLRDFTDTDVPMNNSEDVPEAVPSD